MAKTPFVCYRLPGNPEPVLMQQKKPGLLRLNSYEDFLDKKGFVIWPWEVSSQFPALLLQPDIMESGWEALERLKPPELPDTNVLHIASFTEYEHHIASIKKAIIDGQIEKAILSRIKRISPKDFDFKENFRKLCEQYPQAFCYGFHIPGIGTWMGATPEYLLKLDNGLLETVSLAGSQKDEGQALGSVTWGEKEQHEQQIVTHTIKRRLQKYFNGTLSIQGPITISTGVVLHLKTIFQLDINQEDSGQLANFLKDLHPTPAIGGQPKEQALKVIKQAEPHQRGYYTGFLGPVNIDNSTHLMVNLRCMQVFQDTLALYLGGGITAGSTAQAEWDETELKAQTLLRLLV